jgi:hypothetical protein
MATIQTADDECRMCVYNFTSVFSFLHHSSAGDFGKKLLPIIWIKRDEAARGE